MTMSKPGLARWPAGATRAAAGYRPNRETPQAVIAVTAGLLTLAALARRHPARPDGGECR